MGELKNAGSEEEINVVRGSYSFEGPDGVLYTVNYIADENGFQATGDHLPVAPEIPEAIQRSIEQNAREEEADSKNNQQGYSSGGPARNNQQQGYPSGGPAGAASNNQQGYPSGGPARNNQQQGYPSGRPSGAAATSASKQYLPPHQQQQQQQQSQQRNQHQQAPRNQYLAPNQQQQRQPSPSNPSNQYLPPNQQRNGY